MKLRVFARSIDAHASLAEEVVECVRQKPGLVLGLSTGRTSVGLYRELVRRARAGAIDFSRMTTFNLDEFLGLPPDHPGSYRQFMERHLFRHIGLSHARVNFLDGSAPDARSECVRYEQAIAACGGIDLQILGIGTNGHIGFNEPADWLMVRTHRVELRPETLRANASLFGGDPSRVPREALSMGVGTILTARRIVMLATGRGKARAVARMVHGSLSTMVPASLLQLHGDVDVLMDQPAASKLEHA